MSSDTLKHTVRPVVETNSQAEGELQQGVERNSPLSSSPIEKLHDPAEQEVVEEKLALDRKITKVIDSKIKK